MKIETFALDGLGRRWGVLKLLYVILRDGMGPSWIPGARDIDTFSDVWGFQALEYNSILERPFTELDLISCLGHVGLVISIIGIYTYITTKLI